ncbi:MAG: hypothetical protein JSR85_04985 [Proteobacteria bacterium]|nr:hypothetical protein [Pseudomonadota bacterium]
MIKSYLMVGLIGTMLACTETFAMEDAPLFIDGQNVNIRVSYLKMQRDSFKETRPGVRQFQVARKTLGTEKNVTRYSRVDLIEPRKDNPLSTFKTHESLPFQWHQDGYWFYPPNVPATGEAIFIISPVTKIVSSKKR